MKTLACICACILAIVCRAQEYDPKTLLSAFRRQPNLSNQPAFQSVVPIIHQLDSACSLKVYKTVTKDHELSFSVLIRNEKAIAYSYFSEPCSIIDTPSYIGDIEIMDTFKSSIASGYDTFIHEHSIVSGYAYLLSPLSGLDFGFEGGYAVHERRVNSIFGWYKDSIPLSEFHVLLCALNPYTRIMAAEYYVTHKRKFRKYKEQLYPILERIVNDTASLYYYPGGCTMNGMRFRFTPKSAFRHYNRIRWSLHKGIYRSWPYL